MGLNREKSELKCLNTVGRKSQIMEYCSYRKLIPLMTLSSIGMTILKVNCSFSHGTTNSCRVMIGYLGSNKIKVNKIKNDNQGRVLIVDADIDEETFVLINLYKKDTETEQIKTIYELDQLLGDFCLDSNKKIILAGDFNLSFDPSLETSGGKPALKKINFKTCAYI